MTTTQPAWKNELRNDAEAYLRSRPTSLVWIPCTFCTEDTLAKHTLYAIEKAEMGEVVLGAVCEDCKEDMRR